MQGENPLNVVVLGAGVAGLTTAYCLSQFASRRGESRLSLNITLVAKHLPGDVNPTEYCSPQGGANWRSFEKELNQYGQYDKVAFERFVQIAQKYPESGVKPFPLRLVYGKEDDKLKEGFWFEDLVGGIVDVPKNELPKGADWGVDLTTFMYNPTIYCDWYETVSQVLVAC